MSAGGGLQRRASGASLKRAHAPGGACPRPRWRARAARRLRCAGCRARPVAGGWVSAPHANTRARARARLVVGVFGELLLQALQRHAVCAGQVKLRRAGVFASAPRGGWWASGCAGARASPRASSSASSMAAAPQPGADTRSAQQATAARLEGRVVWFAAASERANDEKEQAARSERGARVPASLPQTNAHARVLRAATAPGAAGTSPGRESMRAPPSWAAAPSAVRRRQASARGRCEHYTTPSRGGGGGA